MSEIKTTVKNGEKYASVKDMINYFSRCKLENRDSKNREHQLMCCYDDYMVDFLKTL